MTTAKNNKQPWTHEEIARVAELKAQGLSAPKIAEQVGRTTAAIHKLQNRINQGFAPENAIVRKPWTDDESDTAHKLRAEGLSYAAIGRKLGRSAGSVEQRFSRRGRLRKTLPARRAAVAVAPSPRPKKRWCYILGDAKVPVEQSDRLPAGGRFGWEIPTDSRRELTA